MSRRVLLIGATGWVLLGAVSAFGQGAAVRLPSGVRAAWDVGEAWHEATPTREKICINGLWRWQPAEPGATAVPAGDWGYFKVPGCWPGIADYAQKDCQTVFANPAWRGVNLRTLQAAWYERTFTVPAGWTGRRVVLTVDCLNSWARVYLDGRPVGTLRFPAGRVDLTAACKPGETCRLDVRVIAVPLKAVMLSFNNTSAPKEVRGTVARRGLCGDLYLVGTPAGARIDDLKVDTSVRNWQITFNTALAALAPGASYRLKAGIIDHGHPVAQFTSARFTSAELKDGRYAFTHDWRPAGLWDTVTPRNQYDVRLSLTDAAGRLLDEALPVRFGFREFWIKGRDFYLNGTRIYLSAAPIDNAQIGAAWATYSRALDSLKRLQGIGINYVYADDYSCTPGSSLSLGAVLRAADDAGMLVGVPMPQFGNYDWKTPDADTTNGYARTAAYYVRAAEHHPSVVFYPMSHNALGYFDENDPDKIDGLRSDRDDWGNRNVRNALRAQAIVNRLDPTRIVYHHAGGDVGAMYTLNFYPNFVPVQELDDWFEHWATSGVKPFFTCEYGAPYPLDWSMFRGWYHGVRNWGSLAMPYQLCNAEWNSQFLGDRAFALTSNASREDLAFEAKQLRAGKAWYRWDYPHPIVSNQFPERGPVYTKYLVDNWRAYRTWGLSGISPWIYQTWWRLRRGADTRRVNLPVDWEHLQQPGYSADYLDQRYQDMAYAYQLSDWQPTLAGKALIRNNGPVLAYIGGKPGEFTEKGHNFAPGQTVEKQLILINNSRRTETGDCSWSFDLPAPLSGHRQVSIQTGNQARIPLAFKLPDSVVPGRYQITATVKFSTGQAQTDSFGIDVMAGPTTPNLAANVALFDPKGETKALLDRLGVHYQVVGADADLSPYGVLVVGKEALTLEGPAPDVSRVRQGLRVVLFEQTSQVLEKRFGFRTLEYGLRRIFERVPSSPLLTGLAEANLHDWRGSATLTRPRIHFPPSKWKVWDGAPVVEWAGLTVPQAWRAGNRGNVASVLIEKPACGDFLPIVDGGYSLQYSPLMVYREGKGLVLFCEMDVTGRTERDPAAEQLAANVLSYARGWRPAPARTALYAGDPAGLAHLQASGVAVSPYPGGAPGTDQVLVVGPGAGSKLASSAPDIAGWLKAGGDLLAIGLDQRQANAFLPEKVSTKEADYIQTCFTPSALGPLTIGIGPADVFNRDPRPVPLVTGGARPIGDGVMATGGGGHVVFYQLAPWRFDAGINSFKRTFRRTSCAVNRILANMDCVERTPLLARFSESVGPKETRCRVGLYLDQPQVWDDPYRYFGW
jgi:beta-galactosidase